MKKLILLSLCTLFIAGASQGSWTDSQALDKADSQAQPYKCVQQRVFESAEAGMNQSLQTLEVEMLPSLLTVQLNNYAASDYREYRPN